MIKEDLWFLGILLAVSATTALFKKATPSTATSARQISALATGHSTGPVHIILDVTLRTIEISQIFVFVIKGILLKMMAEVI